MPSARTIVASGLTASILVGSLAGGVANSIITRITRGSSINQGDTYYVTNNAQVANLSNTNPSIFVNSGAVKTYGTSGQIPGGGIRLSMSGTSLLKGLWATPSKYSSGGVLDMVSLECDDTPATAYSGSLVINCPTAKASISQCDTVVRNYIQLSSGALIFFNTGTTIATKLRPGKYMGFIGENSGGLAIAKNNCVIRPIAHEKYGR